MHQMRPTLVIAAALFFSAALPAQGQGQGEQRVEEKPLVVFAAASTRSAMQNIKSLYAKDGRALVVVHAASSILARQIENGAPADVYISANPAWMDYLQSRNLIEPESRINVAGNRLVMIAPSAIVAQTPQRLSPTDAINRYLKDASQKNSRLALADPAHVPAGIYARQALQNLGLWRDVEPRLARTLDVTRALLLVAREAAPLGIVYASDVGLDARVLEIAAFPEGAHQAIVYPAAIIQGRSTRAREFLELLVSAEGRAAIEQAGFSSPTLKDQNP